MTETEPHPSDADLIARVSDGDDDAASTLWDRHASAGFVAAEAIGTDRPHAEVVLEAFGTLLAAMRTGGTFPNGLRAAVYPEVARVLGVTPGPGDPDDAIAPAFASLPHEWRQVLWLSDIERMQPNDVATIAGVAADDIDALISRSRDGLRDAWVRRELDPAPFDELTPTTDDHTWVRERLTPLRRGTLGERQRARATEHLKSCPTCAAFAATASHVPTLLGERLLTPMVGAQPTYAMLTYFAGAATGAIPVMTTAVPLDAGALRGVDDGAAPALPHAHTLDSDLDDDLDEVPQAEAFAPKSAATSVVEPQDDLLADEPPSGTPVPVANALRSPRTTTTSGAATVGSSGPAPDARASRERTRRPWMVGGMITAGALAVAVTVGAVALTLERTTTTQPGLENRLSEDVRPSPSLEPDDGLLVESDAPTAPASPSPVQTSTPVPPPPAAPPGPQQPPPPPNDTPRQPGIETPEEPAPQPAPEEPAPPQPTQDPEPTPEPSDPEPDPSEPPDDSGDPDPTPEPTQPPDGDDGD